ncbi:MAG: choice-of-anchor D domain-containing protein [Myxococcales bacterium]|nr:choice-of-anchor D domain-containing protein [Myxococcales bacterium]
MQNSRRMLLAYMAFFVLLAGVSLTTACTCGDPPSVGVGELATDLDNNQLIFSNVQVGQPSTKEFILYNKGSIDVRISELVIDRDQGNVFSITNPPTFPLTLKPGKENGVALKVQFLTQQTGDFFARIHITSDANNVDPDSGFFVIRLNHQILTAEPFFDCGKSLNFGTVEKGQSKTMECTITNRGNADLTIEKAEYVKEKGSDGDFKILEPGFPVTIKADPNSTASVTFKIAYNPSDYPPAEDQGEFKLFTNVSGENEANRSGLKVVGITAVPLVQLVPFYGECQDDNACRRIDNSLSCQDDAFSGKKLCLPTTQGSTPTLLFPLTSKGKTTIRKFLVRSTGDIALEVSKIELDSNSSLDFRVDNSTITTPLKIEPKQEVLVNVEYTPSDDQQDSGVVKVDSNAGNLASAPIQLQASSRGCNLEVNPDPKLGVKFTGPRSQRVTIYNIGNENCVIDKIALEKGAPYSLVPTQPEGQAIAPNGLIEFLVKFDAKDKTAYPDNLVVTSSDPDEPVIKLPLNGQITGTQECELEATPAQLQFPLTPVGRNRRLSVQIKNKGYSDCIIEQAKPITITGTNPAGNTAFTLDTQVSYPIVLPSGESRRFEINYTPPQSISGYQGELIIESNDITNPKFKVVLNGASGNLCLEVVPSQMDFGSSKVGCATPDRDINIFNLGAQGCSSSITVSKVSLGSGTSSEFELRSVPNLPKTLNSGDSVVIKARYKPTDLDVDFGTLDIENNVQGQSPLSIPLAGEGVNTSEQKDVFSQLRQPKADIMIVVDDSCSMYEEQNNLASNFQSFISWAVRLNVDYHIMVTTTDVTTSGSKIPGCARLGTGSPARIISQATPNPEAAFQANARAGTNGSATEEGLEAAYKALTPPASTNANCNRDFYRTDASLSMIFISDELDQSPQPVNFYITFFKNLKGFRNLDLIRASSIVGPSPSGCSNPTTGNAQHAPRYIEVATQLNGVNESICNSDWAGTLSKIGAITFGYRKQFFLSRQADPPTITVKVNGLPSQQNPNDGWTYDPTTNSIIFSQSKVPPPGAAVEVQYQALCLQ